VQHSRLSIAFAGIVVLSCLPVTAPAEQAPAAPKGKEIDKEALKTKLRSLQNKDKATTAKAENAPGQAAASKPPKKEKQETKIDVTQMGKLVYNQAAGFGLPVPPGWSAKIEGTKIILTSPGAPADQTVITMGPEPSDLEAMDYLAEKQKEMADRDKIFTIPQPPQDFLDKTIYIAGYMDNKAQPPGIGAILVMDRPGDQVFVIRVLTRDEGLLKNTAVLGSMAMLRFRGEPLPSIDQLMKAREKKVRLVPDRIVFEPGKGTRADMRLPKIIKDFAKKNGAKGSLNRYRMAIATPKSYNLDKVWPVLFIGGAVTEEEIARYQNLADEVGVVVVALAQQQDAPAWSAEVRTRVCHHAFGHLSRVMALDRTRVYLMDSGANGKGVQIVAALLPLCRGVICHNCGEDELTAVLAQSADAKVRLAAAAATTTASKTVTPAQAEALVAAWKKAGLTDAKAFVGKDDRQSVRDALKWLLDRDQSALSKELPKMMADAEALSKDKPGEALTLYRRIVGSGLKGEQTDKAAKAVKELYEKYRALAKQVSTQGTESDATKVADSLDIALKFQGSLEGSQLLSMLLPSLKAQ